MRHPAPLRWRLESCRRVRSRRNSPARRTVPPLRQAPSRLHCRAHRAGASRAPARPARPARPASLMSVATTFERFVTKVSATARPIPCAAAVTSTRRSPCNTLTPKSTNETMVHRRIMITPHIACQKPITMGRMRTHYPRCWYPIAALIGFGAAPVWAAQATPVSVNELRCEYSKDPIGIDAQQPRRAGIVLHQKLREANSLRNNCCLQLENLNAENADVWDSGRIESDQSIQVHYHGKPLRSGGGYHWKVRVWDEEGRPTKFSEPGYWEMG